MDSPLAKEAKINETTTKEVTDITAKPATEEPEENVLLKIYFTFILFINYLLLIDRT